MQSRAFILPRVVLTLALGLATGGLTAQRPMSRQAVIDAALVRGPYRTLIAVDTLRSAADVRVAGVRLLPNVNTSYTGSSPQYHIIGELPLDGLLLRGQRVGVASALQRSARSLYQLNAASIAFDADTGYTRALATDARAKLSRRTATDADSLRHIAEVRRDAGDASELDVQLATISAGQLANAAAIDSTAAIGALLDLQLLIGVAPDVVSISLTDSLIIPQQTDATVARANPLRVAAARSALDAATAQVALEKRSRFGTPSLTAGVEKGDPSGSQPQALPTVGVALPIPFPGRNRGAIEVAEAERLRAASILSVTSLQSQRQIAVAERARVTALARVARDQRLLSTADRVASLALVAYREGAAPLPNVLEARRNARDVLAQYIDDVAALWIALASQRLVTLSERP